MVFVNDFFLRLVHSLYYLGWNRMCGFEREIRPSSSDLIVVEYIVTLFSRCIHLLNL